VASDMHACVHPPLCSLLLSHQSIQSDKNPPLPNNASCKHGRDLDWVIHPGNEELVYIICSRGN